jgi:hypothetical protein
MTNEMRNKLYWMATDKGLEKEWEEAFGYDEEYLEMTEMEFSVKFTKFVAEYF